VTHQNNGEKGVMTEPSSTTTSTTSTTATTSSATSSATVLDAIQEGLANLISRGDNAQRDDGHQGTAAAAAAAAAAAGAFAVLNPLPSRIRPFRYEINAKCFPLVVFSLHGTAQYSDIASVKYRLLELLLWDNHGMKLDLVFDVKRVNHLDLGALYEVYEHLVLADPDGMSALLRHVNKACILFQDPESPGLSKDTKKESKEVVSVFLLAFLGFKKLRQTDQRYRSIKYKVVYHNRDVDAFMKASS
jgi:hypothetical protein